MGTSIAFEVMGPFLIYITPFIVGVCPTRKTRGTHFFRTAISVLPDMVVALCKDHDSFFLFHFGSSYKDFLGFLNIIKYYHVVEVYLH